MYDKFKVPITNASKTSFFLIGIYSYADAIRIKKSGEGCCFCKMA